MNSAVHNFYSGPARLPAPVLEQARAEMLDFKGTGISVMEISHRSDSFVELIRSAEKRLRSLLSIPSNYRVLFMQGGASLQFSMVPLNFLSRGRADYLITGIWGRKALDQARGFGNAEMMPAGQSDLAKDVPAQEELQLSADAVYLHYVSNETIDGVEFHYDVEGYGVPVVCDASSNILSKPIDVSKYDLIYAGAQKNIGPSGVTVVIISDRLLGRAAGPGGILDYRSFLKEDAMPHTPNTWGIYIIDLVCTWLEAMGGLDAAKIRNEEKARRLYEEIERSDGFYTGSASVRARSNMNVTFRLPSEPLEIDFCREAEQAGLIGLRGHRSTGGIRASIYNAFPMEGVETLVSFMEDFARRKG